MRRPWSTLGRRAKIKKKFKYCFKYILVLAYVLINFTLANGSYLEFIFLVHFVYYNRFLGVYYFHLKSNIYIQHTHECIYTLI